MPDETESSERLLTDEQAKQQAISFAKFFAVFIAVGLFVVVKFS
jgi:hypothetical protein